MVLDYANPDSVAKCIRSVTHTLHQLRNQLLEQGEGPLDVRLVSNADGELWYATGDVQYDTTHGAACEAITINATDGGEDLQAMATDLVNGVADQLAEQQEDE